MNSGSIVLYEAEYSRVKSILSRAQGELRADLVESDPVFLDTE